MIAKQKYDNKSTLKKVVSMWPIECCNALSKFKCIHSTLPFVHSNFVWWYVSSCKFVSWSLPKPNVLSFGSTPQCLFFLFSCPNGFYHYQQTLKNQKFWPFAFYKTSGCSWPLATMKFPGFFKLGSCFSFF